MSSEQLSVISSGFPPKLITDHYSLLTSNLVGLTLLGFALRLYLLNRFPFREDEAIYSVWALHFWHVDPLFLTVWPDKPPLFLWCLAAAFRLFGTSQASARWVNVAFSTATIPVVAVTARQLWGRRATFWAALAFALNPFAISFAATAYTDPLLVLAGSLAFYLALTQRTFWAGFWLGIAIMTKQQGVLYVPLVIGALMQHKGRMAKGPYSLSLAPSPLLLFFTGLCLIGLPIIYWDSLRWAVAPSPWDLSIRHYGELKIASISQWLPRLYTWATLAWYLTASWLLWLGGAGLFLYRVFWHGGRWRSTFDPTLALPKGRELSRRFPFCERGRNRAAFPNLFIAQSPNLLLILWSIAFFAIHVITTVQTWDRYLLPLAPPVALLIGWLMHRVTEKYATRSFVVAGLIGLSCFLPPALTTATGHLPIGGDHGAYTGLTDALTWLTTQYPGDVVLYHQNLGWHERFYLYDQVATGAYELRWFPSAVYLADNVAKTPSHHKFFLQPNWSPVRNLELHLAIRRLAVQERGRFGQFTLYEIAQSPLQ